VVEGNLHFANVRMEDARNGSSYLCVVMNSELRSLAQGDDQKIQPVRRTGISLSSLDTPYTFTVRHVVFAFKPTFYVRLPAMLGADHYNSLMISYSYYFAR